MWMKYSYKPEFESSLSPF